MRVVIADPVLAAHLFPVPDLALVNAARLLAREGAHAAGPNIGGDYQREHLFTLRQSLTLYRFLQSQIGECQVRIREELNSWDSKIDPAACPPPPASKKIRVEGLTATEAENLREHCYRVLGVDLTQVDGINGGFVQVFLSEVGADISRFRSASAFASWLKLSPNREVSGGKVLKSKTAKNGSRMAKAFRMAANSLLKSQSALGDCFRRFRTKLGAPKAITALAHKLINPGLDLM